jgi:hypothetical protein
MNISDIFRHTWSSLFFKIILIIFLALSSNFSHSAEITATWNPVEGATGYKLYYGPGSRFYSFVIDVGPSLEYRISDLDDDQLYFFAVTAYNDYSESDYSEEVAYAAKAPDLVSKLHQDILGVTSVPSETQLVSESQIMGLVSKGIDIKEVFISFSKFLFNSISYISQQKTNEDYVRDLYQVFFNQAASPKAVQSLSSLLKQRWNQQELFNSFAFSKTFERYLEDLFGIYLTLPEYDLINDLYRGFLDRPPGMAEFKSKAELMREAILSGEEAVGTLLNQIALELVQSTEYINKNKSVREFLEDCYDGFLRKIAFKSVVEDLLQEMNDGMTYEDNLIHSVDSSESQLQEMNDGMTYEDILIYFVHTSEFQYRIKTIMEKIEVEKLGFLDFSFIEKIEVGKLGPLDVKHENIENYKEIVITLETIPP